MILLFLVGDTRFLGLGELMVISVLFFKKVRILFSVGNSCFLGLGVSVSSDGNYFLRDGL